LRIFQSAACNPTPAKKQPLIARKNTISPKIIRVQRADGRVCFGSIQFFNTQHPHLLKVQGFATPWRAQLMEHVILSENVTKNSGKMSVPRHHDPWLLNPRAEFHA